jgi:hypothetical protein
MNKEIEWFEEDGCLGGQRGLTFNIETNLITKWNGVEEMLSETNIDDVKWCVDSNIKNVTERIHNIELKLNQKEIQHIKVNNGYTISEPLTEIQRPIYLTKLNKLILELEWLKSISFKTIESYE